MGMVTSAQAFCKHIEGALERHKLLYRRVHISKEPDTYLDADGQRCQGCAYADVAAPLTDLLKGKIQDVVHHHGRRHGSGGQWAAFCARAAAHFSPSVSSGSLDRRARPKFSMLSIS
eukprot:SAG22_NODE_4_length_44774_cov_362.122149_9_plen_117_part_00